MEQVATYFLDKNGIQTMFLVAGKSLTARVWRAYNYFASVIMIINIRGNSVVCNHPALLMVEEILLWLFTLHKVLGVTGK